MCIRDRAKAVVESLGADGEEDDSAVPDDALDDCDYDDAADAEDHEELDYDLQEGGAHSEEDAACGGPRSERAESIELSARHASFIVCPYYRVPFGQKYVEGVAVEEGEGLGPRKELFALLGDTATRDWSHAGGFEHGLRVAPRREGDGFNVLRLVVDDENPTKGQGGRGDDGARVDARHWVAKALSDGNADSGASHGGPSPHSSTLS